MSKPILAWHFLPADRCLRFPHLGKRGLLVKPGTTLGYPHKQLQMCARGLHASLKPLDAAHYAYGPIICRVELRGYTIEDHDKLCSSWRRVLWMADATDILRAFACRCALEVAELWNMPDVVRQYLETRNEALLDEARIAAAHARWGVAQREKWDAARDAAVDAAAIAPCHAAWGAAWEAARCTAWGEAKDSAHTVVWRVVHEKYNGWLEKMLLELAPEGS